MYLDRFSLRCNVFFLKLFDRNDLLLPGICVKRADTELFYHHSKNPEEGDRYQECDPALRDVPCPAWIPPSTQQPSTGVYQICLPGILLKYINLQRAFSLTRRQNVQNF